MSNVIAGRFVDMDETDAAAILEHINRSSLEIVRKGDGLALLRGGEVFIVLTRDELPQLGVACAVALSER